MSFLAKLFGFGKKEEATTATEAPSEEKVVEKPEEVETVSVPVVAEPVAEEPVAEEPVAEEPVAEEPVAEEPVAEEPVAEEPVAEEPVAEEPVAEEPVAEEPVAEEPVAVPDPTPAPIAAFTPGFQFPEGWQFALERREKSLASKPGDARRCIVDGKPVFTRFPV